MGKNFDAALSELIRRYEIVRRYEHVIEPEDFKALTAPLVVPGDEPHPDGDTKWTRDPPSEPGLYRARLGADGLEETVRLLYVISVRQMMVERDGSGGQFGPHLFRWGPRMPDGERSA